jgi:hypothetical protein
MNTVSLGAGVGSSADGGREVGVDVVNGMSKEANGFLDTAELGVKTLAPAVDCVLLE